MDSLRYKADVPSLVHPRDPLMEERYRQLQYEAAQAQYWSQAPAAQTLALPRYQRHPKSQEKVRMKEVQAYHQYAHRDKYGSVSAHSTSAIYGALRAPQYRAIYGTGEQWYNSVRSLNREAPRELAYSIPEGYDRRYEGGSLATAYTRHTTDMVAPGWCDCMVRNRQTHDKFPASLQQTRCSYCTPHSSHNGFSNGKHGSSNGKLSVNGKSGYVNGKSGYTNGKVGSLNGHMGSLNGRSVSKKLRNSQNLPILEERDIPEQQPTCRMSAYRSAVPGSSKYRGSSFTTKESGVFARKSILECDVNPYDLIKDESTYPIPDLDDSDMDDNLNDNAVLKRKAVKSRSKCSSASGSSRQIANRYSKLKKSDGDQRVHSCYRTKSQDTNYLASVGAVDARWRHLPSDRVVEIPEPDYDVSDESDDGTVIDTKGFDSLHIARSAEHNDYNEVSFPLDNAFVPETDEDVAYQVSENTMAYPPHSDTNGEEMQNGDGIYSAGSSTQSFTMEGVSESSKSKSESSSSCSSSGGTVSSDYPTWNSSSSNELKSILKNKRCRASVIQEPTIVIDEQKDSKDAQRKKQVQFHTGGDEVIDDPFEHDDGDEECDIGTMKDEKLNENSDENSINEQCQDYSVISFDADNNNIVEVINANEELLVAAGSPEACLDELPEARYWRLERGVQSEPQSPVSSPRLQHRPTRCVSLLDLRLQHREEARVTGQSPQPESVRARTPDSPSSIGAFCFDFFAQKKDRKEKDKAVVSTSRSTFYYTVEDEISPDISAMTISEAGDTCDIVAPSMNERHKQSQKLAESSDTDCDIGETISKEDHDMIPEDSNENEYEHIDPIYEDIAEFQSDVKSKSLFMGASKSEILSYLLEAKHREKWTAKERTRLTKPKSVRDTEQKLGEGEKSSHDQLPALVKIEEDTENDETGDGDKTEEDVPQIEEESPKVVEEEDEPNASRDEKTQASDEAGEASKPDICSDCDRQVEQANSTVCEDCKVLRRERKESITELVDTEFKYGRDLRIMKEELLTPMEVAGLLARDQLSAIFLNLEELREAHRRFYADLREALDAADQEYISVNIGRIFLDHSSMLNAFETYCINHSQACALLGQLEKEKELLRVFLHVSQKENVLLRRMNLAAFLMVPVQRVTKFPLLLTRLHKATPVHHKDRLKLKEAEIRLALHLYHINNQTKEVGGTKIWRRISNISTQHRRVPKEFGNIKLKKMALDVLEWNEDEAKFAMAGKLQYAQITDYPWTKKGKNVKFAPVQALLIALGKPNANYNPESYEALATKVLFPKDTGIRDASLMLMKEKNGKFVPVRDPLHLKNCVISFDKDHKEYFEIQDLATKETFLFKGDSTKDTKEWLAQLRYHAKDLGEWRKRRNALANIMMHVGMIGREEEFKLFLKSGSNSPQ